ncbi:hypothetical protein BG015_007033 [Linnemannia schmuckeri]|uniref:LITAF domain-containing protein n=1 Tax=Linnemannia schmuckeri TaxID=64567 RepID=A0A9P5VBF3_9FUNG|nr:hypothetical protein BG015_007033 [Linnemannia schmuckeri]
MSDRKGQYTPVNTNDNDDHPQNALLAQGFQPPPYTPSTAPSSPYIAAHDVAGPSSTPAAGLYPQIYNPPQQQPYQPTYQHPKFADHSKPPPTSARFAPQPPNQQPNCMASPLIMMRPPGRIEDLKAKPGVVVCPHCHYLVLTETTPENGSCTYLGILGLLLAGITSCGCCLLPLCITSTKDIMHSCPNCHEDVGLYSRLKERTFPQA